MRQALLLLAAACWRLACPATAGEVVHGRDDRVSVHEVGDAAIRRLAESTVIITSWESGRIAPDEQVELNTEPYGTRLGFERHEPFYGQPTMGGCSGALVGPDLVLTAGHCVKNAEDCRNHRIVFNHRLSPDGVRMVKLTADDFYGCAEHVAGVYSDKNDWALVRLDRVVKGHAPLPVALRRHVRRGQKVFVIGHPRGLPAIFSGNAIVVNEAKAQPFFKTNLDTAPGSSGSPVFDAATLEIVGVHVRGSKPLSYPAGRTIVVPDPQAQGAETKVASFAFILEWAIDNSRSRALPGPTPGIARATGKSEAAVRRLGAAFGVKDSLAVFAVPIGK